MMKYVALGDSITAYRFHVKTYFERIAERIGAVAAVQCINNGVGGWNSQHLLEHLEEKCLQYDPDIVSIMIGTNDHAIYKGQSEPAISIENYEKNLREIVRELYHNLPKRSSVILMTPPFVATQTSPAGTKTSQDRLVRYCRIVHEMCQEFSTSLVDCNAIIGQAVHYNESTFTCDYTDRLDGVHLNSKAHQIVSPYIELEIRRAIESGRS